MKKSIEVVAAIIRRSDPQQGDTFLAAERGYGEFRGWWEFPGGKMEPGETQAEAIEREIREELGMQVAAERLLCTVECDYPAFHLTMHCLLCRISEGQPHRLEHDALRWVTLDEAASLRWLPADVEALEALGKLRNGGNAGF